MLINIILNTSTCIKNVNIKGSRPVSRVLSRTVIHLGCPSPGTSSDLPGNGAGRAMVPLFGLAPGGVYPANPVTRGAVRSYRTISPLPVPRRNGAIGGIFSAALSVGSRLPGVTWHPALWSPDFPPWPTPQRLSGRLPPLLSPIGKETNSGHAGGGHASRRKFAVDNYRR